MDTIRVAAVNDERFDMAANFVLGARARRGEGTGRSTAHRAAAGTCDG